MFPNRRRGATFLRGCLLFFLVFLLWKELNINVQHKQAEHREPDPDTIDLPLVRKGNRRSASFDELLRNGAIEVIITTETTVDKPNLNISEIKELTAKSNEEQQIFNVDLHGPLQKDSLIIVVQVHTRIIYLKYLIDSLAEARDISQVLLIFSHDFYSEAINTLVRSIKFCKVMQIFYPHSIQMHPHEFPGEEPDDCPKNISRHEAMSLNCTNAPYPDTYGHYREAYFTQTKHHWWWKANRVFNQLSATVNHTGLVLFLEEDHYVVEDFIHYLRLMKKTCETDCPNCNILAVGSYLKITPRFLLDRRVEITQWLSGKHNMGVAFNRSTWEEIAKCADIFCRYDDYNWDWTLQFVSYTCLRNPLYAMVARGTRVFHIGDCGVHHKSAKCDPIATVAKVRKALWGGSKFLYPKSLLVALTDSRKKLKLKRGNGGWADIRDHMLCLDMIRHNV